MIHEVHYFLQFETDDYEINIKFKNMLHIHYLYLQICVYNYLPINKFDFYERKIHYAEC